MFYREKAYTRINWKNRPNLSTPLGAKNLNKMDATLNELDDRILEVSSEVERDSLTIGFISDKVNSLEEDVAKNTSQINELSNLSEDVNGLKIVNTASGNTAYIDDASNMGLENIIFYGESTQNGTPTPTSPIPIESKIVNRVDVLRKNLLQNTATSQTNNSVAFTVNSDGSVKANGTNSSATGIAFVEINTKVTLNKGSYLASIGNNDASGTFGLNIWNTANVSQVYFVYNTDIRIDVAEDNTSFWVRFFVAKGATVSNKTIFPMIRPSFFTDGTYEPYQSQTVNLSAPIELNGIGDVRDTIEIYSDGTGKYIQRIGKVVANKNTRFNTLELSTLQRVSFTITNMLNLSGRNADVLSSHFVASIEGTIYSMFHAGTEVYLYVGVNNATDFNSFIADKEITFYYPIAEPIETSLPQADIDAIKSLHTYKPNTVVMNDADAEMDVHYVADPKLYVDKKFEALASAIVNQ